MKNKLSIAGIIIGILFTAVGVILNFTPLQFSFALPSISSPDGPTAVFVAGRVGQGAPMTISIIGIIIIIVSVVLGIRRKK